MKTYRLFATAPLGLELLLAEELISLGAEDIKDSRAGVAFSADLSTAYRVCLWSRLASRVLLNLSHFPVPTAEALYAGVGAIDWSAIMETDASLVVDFASSKSQITHTHFGALKVKDAIVDQLRDADGNRPRIELNQPDIRVNVYVERDIASVSLDLSGDSLHRRGYRLEGGTAPLKENLAAAILLRAGWPDIARQGGELLDPMCGSGTLLIEAAWMAADCAPGLQRTHYGFTAWKQHRASLWQDLLDEARRRRAAGLSKLPPISGYDVDHSVIKAAAGNIERAGLQGLVQVHAQAADAASPVREKGLLVTNPPYGERLGEARQLVGLYTELGTLCKTHFQGWQASVLTDNPEMAFKLGIRARKSYRLYNGAIECRLFNFDIAPERFFTPHGDESGLSEEARHARKLLRRARGMAEKGETGVGAEMFANRLHKNFKHIGRWARQDDISCYRVYDADLPEYAVAVDIYQGVQTWVHVQEYAAPASIDPQKAEDRLTDALAAIPSVLAIPPEQLFLKIRRRQKGSAQYQKQADTGNFHWVEEGGCQLQVNFEDYLDTGLFLDHRPTRMMIQRLANDKHFLNLFAYTGAATVHAAKGGAKSTTTVDMSPTYLDWARRNLEQNGMKGYRHSLIEADCMAWLDGEAGKGRGQFDLIFIDPPTFSNSKRMERDFDIQRDHVRLLRTAARLLSPGGLMVFSSNFRRLKLDMDALDDFAIEDISPTTIPKDFARHPKIHACWLIRKSSRRHDARLW